MAPGRRTDCSTDYILKGLGRQRYDLADDAGSARPGAADRSGRVHDTPQRRCLVFVDGIIAGKATGWPRRRATPVFMPDKIRCWWICAAPASWALLRSASRPSGRRAAACRSLPRRWQRTCKKLSTALPDLLLRPPEHLGEPDAGVPAPRSTSDLSALLGLIPAQSRLCHAELLSHCQPGYPPHPPVLCVAAGTGLSPGSQRWRRRIRLICSRELPMLASGALVLSYARGQTAGWTVPLGHVAFTGSGSASRLPRTFAA